MSNCPAGGHAGPGPCHSARQLRLPAVTNRGARPPAQGHSPPATGQKQPPKKQMHANELPSSAGPAGTSAGQKPLAHPTAALPAAGASKPWGCGPDGAGEEAKFSLKLPCKTMRPYRRLARGTHTPVLACSTQAPRDSGKRQQPAGVGEQGAAQASPRLWPPFLRQTTPEQPQPWGRLRRSQLRQPQRVRGSSTPTQPGPGPSSPGAPPLTGWGCTAGRGSPKACKCGLDL